MAGRFASSRSGGRVRGPAEPAMAAGEMRGGRGGALVPVAGAGERRRRWLPPAAEALLRYRAAEFIGLGLLIVGTALCALLFSYHPADPSWNTAGVRPGATPGHVHNLLGASGSHIADLLMQTLGAAAYGSGILFLLWGWRMFRHMAVRRWPVRLLLGMAGLLLLALTLAGVAAPEGWPAGTHLGGSAGALLRGLALGQLRGLVGPDAESMALPLFSGLSVLTLIGAIGLSPREWWLGVRGAGRRVGAIRGGVGGAVGSGEGRDRFPAGAPGYGSASRAAPAAPPFRSRSDAAPAESGFSRPGAASQAGRALGGIMALGMRAGAWLGGLARRRFAASPPGAMSGRGGADIRRDPFFGETGRADHPVAGFAAGPATAGREGGVLAAGGCRGGGVEAGPMAGGGGGVAVARSAAGAVARSAAGAVARSAVGAGPGSAGDPLDYELPPLELLQAPTAGHRVAAVSEEERRANATTLEGVLADFGVRGVIHKVNPGPVVTLYELEPAPGVKSSRVISLADDLARSMSALSVRVAVVPGRNVIGIELPNPRREVVLLRELLASEAYGGFTGRLPLVLGKDIGGEPVVADLARMPHLLIAGTTGSGKSVGINTMIVSLLYRLSPDRCRFIMVDPKMLELSVYEGIPHLLTPVVTDPKKAVVALKWTVREMEDRYRAMSKLGVRNIDGYNARLKDARRNGEVLTRRVQTGFDADTGKPVFEEQPLDLAELPYIVVVVDEMADLMLVAGKDIEAAIQRLAQMARAAGIHLIMATQRPSVDVITGTIKANFPTRISFQVTSKIDSRTILGEQGAEQLLGQGDMLSMAGGGRLMRVHGPFVRDDEVEAVVRFLKSQGEPSYIDAVIEDEDGAAGSEDDPGRSGSGSGGETSGDALYDKAVAVVCRERKASTSFIQRQLRIGYNSAARLVERMEEEGVVSRPNHAGKREVLAPDSEA